MSDDVALLAILVAEALRRNEMPDHSLIPSHVNLAAALREVLDEAGAEVHVEPKGSRPPPAPAALSRPSFTNAIAGETRGRGVRP